MRNVVITAASNYDFETLRPFFDTLEKTGYEGKRVLFLGNHTKETIDGLSRYPKLEIIRFNDTYPYFIDHTDRYSQYITETDFKPHPKTLRYLLTRAFLLAHQDEFDYVLIADSRDVIFQKNPFSFEKSKTFYAFEEDRTNTIRTNHFNSLWIREAFGESELDKIGHHYILCSGVSIGHITPFLDYLSVMEKYIRIVRDRGCKDQGIHNYVIYNGLIEEVTIMEDDAGPVSTIAYFKPKERIRIDKNNMVMGRNGQPVHIVHQYDRILKLLRNYSIRNYRRHKWNLFKKRYYFLVKPFKG